MLYRSTDMDIGCAICLNQKSQRINKKVDMSKDAVLFWMRRKKSVT